MASCRSHNRSVASAVTALPKATRICAMQRHVQCYNVTTSQRYSAASCPMLQCYNVTSQCSIMSNVGPFQKQHNSPNSWHFMMNPKWLYSYNIKQRDAQYRSNYRSVCMSVCPYLLMKVKHKVRPRRSLERTAAKNRLFAVKLTNENYVCKERYSN